MSQRIIPIRRLEVTVAANSKLNVDASGDAIFVESASSSSALTARVEQRLSGVELADGITIRTGASYKKLPAIYDRITLTNSSGSSVAAVLWVGEGDVHLNVQSEDLAVAVPRFLAAANGGTGQDDTVAAGDTDLWVAGDLVDPTTVYIQNDDGSPAAIRVSMGVNPADDVGLKVQPGETLTLAFGQASTLRIYNPTTAGGAATYRIWYLTDTPTA